MTTNRRHPLTLYEERSSWKIQYQPRHGVSDCHARTKRKRLIRCTCTSLRDVRKFIRVAPLGREIKRISLIIHLVEAGSREKKKKKRRDEVEDKEKSTIIGRPMERNTRGLAQIAVSSNKPTERELASTNWNQTSLPSSLFFFSSVFFSYWLSKRGLKEGA